MTKPGIDLANEIHLESKASRMKMIYPLRITLFFATLLLASFLTLNGCSDNPDNSNSQNEFSESSEFSLHDQDLNKSDTNEIKICSLVWEPFIYYNKAHEKDGPITGLLKDVADEVFSNIGTNNHIELMEAQRCILEVINGRYDVSLVTSPITLKQLPEELTKVEHSIQYQLPVLLVPNTYTGPHLSSFKSLEGMNIGVLIRSSYKRKLENQLDINWVVGKTPDSLWQLISGGKVDAVQVDYQSFMLYRTDYHKVVNVVLPPLDSEPLYWAVNASQEKLGKRISSELKKLESTGKIDHLYMKHLGFTLNELRDMIKTGEFPQTSQPLNR